MQGFCFDEVMKCCDLNSEFKNMRGRVGLDFHLGFHFEFCALGCVFDLNFQIKSERKKQRSDPCNWMDPHLGFVR